MFVLSEANLERNKDVICQLGGPYNENCDRGLENAALVRISF